MATLRLYANSIDENTQTTASVNTTTETVDINMVPTQLELSLIDEVQKLDERQRRRTAKFGGIWFGIQESESAEIIRVDEIQIRVTEGATNVPDVPKIWYRE